MTKASIIISSYNYAAWLPAAIDSALNQTFPNVELLVVDDGSTDSSREVIRSYGDRLLRVFKANGGMASAWNAGLARATGDAVLLLDADDLLAPNAIATAAAALSNPAVVKVHWPVALIDERGRSTGAVLPGRALPEGIVIDMVLRNGPEAIPSVPIHGNLWSRRFLDEVFPLPEAEFRQHSDMYLMTLAPLYGSFRRLAEALSFYRVHGGNDYAALSSAEKNHRNVQLYRTRCELLARAARPLGWSVSSSDWLDGNAHYDWMLRFDRAAAQLMDIIPTGGSFVIVDDAQCADGVTDAVIPGRTVARLMDSQGLPRRSGGAAKAGQYNGSPADDEAAIADVERLRRDGVGFLAVMWCSFWWFEHYGRFFDHLAQSGRLVARSDDVVVYTL